MFKLYSALVVLLLVSCESAMKKAMEEKPGSSSEPKSGEWITKRSDGTIKTRINYKNGLKNGMSYLYYRDGKSLQLELPYLAGVRHGVSKKYFRDGTIYSETTYAEDLLDGVRKTYYSNGKLKSKLTYSEGKPGNDLVEYLLSGSQKSKPEIVLEKLGNELVVSVNPEKCREARFFMGSLPEDGFFDDTSNDLEEFFPMNGLITVDLNVYTRSYLAMQNLICSCKSTQGNPLILSRSFDY